MTHKNSCALIALALIAVPVLGAETGAPQGENIALGKRYTLDPRPNYSYCTDPGDLTQLTDGQYTQGYFWTQKSTVGWAVANCVVITIDLGTVQPIRGASFNSAAGRADVYWPASIVMLASDDGKDHYPVGDLVALSAKHAAPPKDYAIHCFRTGELRTHGRFFSFLVTPTGPYAFVDEITIHKGEAEWLNLPFRGESVTDPKAYQLHSQYEHRVRSDLQAVREAASKTQLPAETLGKLTAELDAIEAVVPDMPRQHEKNARAVLPLNETHARVFRAQAMLWQAQGAAPLTVWAANPWDPLSPADHPPRDGGNALNAALMQAEYRAGAFNLANASATDMKLRLQIAGLPGGANPEYVTVHEVAWTDTREGVPVAAALPEAPRDGNAFIISVPAGLIRQVWLTFHATTLPPGAHRGAILLSNETTKHSLPLSLTVYAFQFPKQPALHVGGFDYTDVAAGRDITPQNRDAVIRHLREHFVDSPWATGAVLPRDLDPARFDDWLQLWPHARQYCVFASVADSFDDAAAGTPEFEQRVRAWVTFWAGHAAQRGLQPAQLVILLVDEPSEARHDNTILAWAKAIRAANTGVRMWEDVCHADPLSANQEMIKLCDVLCPNRPRFLDSAQSYRDYFVQRRSEGTELAFYSCDLAARLADPYSYFRLQGWTAWRYGAQGSHFWAFSDSGGGSSWNEYGMPRSACYVPFFLDSTSVTPGKQMEAIRESVEDFEYFSILRERVAEMERAGQKSEALKHAKDLLASGPDLVLNAPGANAIRWSAAKDRGLADKVRIEVLEALGALDQAGK